MTKTTVLFLATVCFYLCSEECNAQGVGNHLTFSLENCSKTSPYQYQFDIYLTSDGDSASQLTLNSINAGVFYDTCTGSASGHYVSYSGYYIDDTLGEPVLNPYSILPGGTVNGMASIRIREPAYAGGNTGFIMAIGHKYRMGTFTLSSATPFNNCCPNFYLNDTSASGSTLTRASVWYAGPDTTVITTNGTGDGQYSLISTCGCGNGITENVASFYPVIFPNPSITKLHVSLPYIEGTPKVRIYNAVGLLTNSFELNSETADLDISPLPSAIYIIEIQSGSNWNRTKFIKQ